MATIEKLCQKELQDRLKDRLKGIKELENKQKINECWYYRQLLNKKQLENIEQMGLKDIKQIMIKKVQKDYEKKLKKELEKIEKIKAAEPIKHGRMNINWVHNRTWGNCPRGEYKNCFYYQNYKSVTGCGYDKLSQLTSYMLNDDIHMKKYLFDFVEKHHINKNNIQQKLSYGIGMYNGQPYFEGAVGVECHIRILKQLGFTVNHADCKRADLITFDKN